LSRFQGEVHGRCAYGVGATVNTHWLQPPPDVGGAIGGRCAPGVAAVAADTALIDCHHGLHVSRCQPVLRVSRRKHNMPVAQLFQISSAREAPSGKAAAISALAKHMAVSAVACARDQVHEICDCVRTNNSFVWRCFRCNPA
jgi:hypothetical protein